MGCWQEFEVLLSGDNSGCGDRTLLCSFFLCCLLVCGVFLRACVIHGKCVFLMSWYDWRRLWSAALFPVGFVCRGSTGCIPLGARSVCGAPSRWPGCLVCTVVRYSATVFSVQGQVACLIAFSWILSNVPIFFLIIRFCLRWWLSCVGKGPGISWLRVLLSGCNSLWVRA